jgi:sulfur relay protein TusB/DsrH
MLKKNEKRNQILHLIKRPVDNFVREFIEQKSISSISTVVFLQDGVYSGEIKANAIYALKGHAKERGLDTKTTEIDYEELVKKIFEHEKVYLW